MRKLLVKNTWWLLITVLALIASIGYYFFISSETTLRLTPEEQQWLDHHHAFRLTPCEDYAPYEFTDSMGTCVGLSPDLLASVSKRLGIELTLVRIDSRDERRKAILEQRVDLLGAVRESPDWTESVRLTNPIATSQDVIITLNNISHSLTIDSLARMRVSVAQGNSIHEELRKRYPAMDIIPARLGYMCLVDVSLGRADAAIVSLNSASYYIRNKGLPNLKISGYYQERSPICIAVRNDWPLFRSILNKALQSIPEDEREKIDKKWLGIQAEGRSWNRLPWEWITGGLAFIALLMTVILVWNRLLQHQVKAKTQELEQELHERRKTEEALRESEVKYRALFDNASDAIFIYNAERMLAVNSMACERLGYTQTELMVIPPSGVDSPERFARLQEKGHIIFETEHQCKDGKRVPTEATSRIITWDGEPAIMSICRDITERKKAEKEIRLNIDRLNILVDIFQYQSNSIEEYLDNALTKAIEITNSVIGYIYHYSEETRKFTLNSWSKDVMKECTIQEKQTCYELEKTGIWGEAVRQRKPIMINDFQASHPLKKGYPEGHAHLSKYLTIPIFSGNQIVGVVAVANKESDYNNTDIKQLTLFMEVIWTVVERKQAEQALRESEQKFRALFEKGPIGVAYHKMIYDDTGVPIDYFFLDANASYQELTGVDPRGKMVTQAFPGIENDPVNWIGTFGRVAQTGESIRFQTYLQQNDRWYDCVGYQFKPDHFVAAFMEITERKKSEQLLAQEKERLSVTLRSIGDGVITTDTNGTIVMLNKVAEEMTGWKSEEAARRPLQEVFVIVNELTREPSTNPVEDVLNTGSIVELANHTCLISKDGHEIQIADSAAPIRDNESRITGVVLVFRDVTEKQNLTDSMQRAQKLESLGILAGGIAHDFNNMLGGIFGYLDLVKESAAVNKTDQIPKYLDKAIGVFERAKGLTQQLLTFSKGGAPIRKTVQIAPLLQHSATFALSGSNVTCQLNFQDGLWACDCDENQIGQVIDNIVINAKQAMPAGGKVVITACNATDLPGHPGNFVRISMQDQGIGIPPEALSKIFDPFFSTKTSGHGLGLATVFSIVQRHNGWIDVESKPASGTTFHVFIPASHKMELPGTRLETAGHTGTGTVLVMDDEEYLLEIVGTMLQEMGYTVAQAKDGKEALALFSQAEKSGQPFAACILDLTIPGGTGGKAIAPEMRRMHPDAIIIASSGYSEDPVISDPTTHGFTDRIIKPYRKKELTELMMRVLP